jgi:hypothetical protein
VRTSACTQLTHAGLGFRAPTMAVLPRAAGAASVQAKTWKDASHVANGITTWPLDLPGGSTG